MFFSRMQLNNYFGRFINDLLNCNCQECKAAKEADMDIMGISAMKTQLQSHPWVLGFMIYLGRLHFIYYWMRWDFFNSRGGLKNEILDDGFVEKELIETELGRSIFQKAYTRAISMFFPMAFQIQNNETCPYRELAVSRRFPYSEEEPIPTKGFYGVMTKVEIVPEYLDGRIIDLVMEDYPSSGTDAGGDRKLLFALKSVRMKGPESPLRSMERNVLDMVSRIEEPASKNMITLLFAYKWKDQMHFLFPFIEWNLDHVLRHGKFPRKQPSKLGAEEKLLEHWLWREMKGVCCALKVFHKMMKNPFPDIEGIVIGLHFDLKPANILVTTDGKLKITDFGQSIIQILGKGEDMFVPHSPGDSRYAAPESRPTLDYTKNGSEDIKVLLNYDVWSLGCIMVEVLIHMLPLQTLEDFDQRLAEEQPVGFFTGTELKQCVASFLQDLQAMFHDTPQGQYMVTVSELIGRMLSHDIKERPFSEEVFDELERAKKEFVDPSKQRDRITPAVKAYNLLDGTGFKELGWDNGQSIVSFADKTGITVELVDQSDGHRVEPPRPCRIRLFRGTPRQKQAPVEIALVWGVDRGGKLDVKQKRVELSRWCFSPTYLFRDGANSNGRFECRLFPIMGLPGQRMSYDLAFIFAFESLEVNNGHKVFKDGGNFAGKHCVNIVNNIATKHESYLVWQLPPRPAWQFQNLNERPHASSSILLEADYQKTPGVDNDDSFKVEDFNRLQEGTNSEWEED
ncbi:kinase-like domain-containing protein [Fusarium flagelliforme]|uniref:kinase-like domain-containing protein n=1 Tax=Fusarium flagelliforme TaxID=2675880 RepID=UPI001E8D44ED|nr:kinase-like domain-containing protein [Fusarium flagelliforme]KAH7198906.1 kinase-like domain-containing protein [Fusarium flagelliforme]